MSWPSEVEIFAKNENFLKRESTFLKGNNSLNIHSTVVKIDMEIAIEPINVIWYKFYTKLFQIS